MATAESAQKRNNNNQLNIDNVVSSHPELGPCPPDGGYGWIILISAIITQIMIPSILCSYGLLMVYLNLHDNYDDNEAFGLWDRNIVLVPILATVFWLLFEPWSRTIVLITNRPRIVSFSGIFLMSAGVMLSNFTAENGENEVLINIFSGIFSGIGASLTTQQADILLKHYFRKKLFMIQTIYKTTIIIGYIVISTVMGALFLKYGPSLAIIIYSGIIMQTCIALASFTRPTYITQPLQKNYKMLQEACEDEDEDIYSSQAQIDSVPNKESVDKYKQVQENTAQVGDDDQDEHVIGTFNTANTLREVIEPTPPVLFRMESNSNPFGSNFADDLNRIESLDDPSSLYRETTVANDVPSGNNFLFDRPAENSGTARRNVDNKKNIMIFFSIMRDLKFYINTYIFMTLRFSMLVFGVLYPPYVAQQIPNIDTWRVTELVVVVYFGAACLNAVTAFLAHLSNKKVTIRLFSLAAFVGFIGLTESSSRSWLVLWGVMTTFSVTAMYITQQPIYDNMGMKFDATVISTASNCIAAFWILLIMLVHNYSYATLFKVAACLQLLTPFLCFYL